MEAPDVSEKMHYVYSKGLKIFPKFDMNHRFAVCIEDENNLVYKKRITVGEFKHTTKSINKAILSALDSVYDKIISKQL